MKLKWGQKDEVTKFVPQVTHPLPAAPKIDKKKNTKLPQN